MMCGTECTTASSDLKGMRMLVGDLMMEDDAGSDDAGL